MVGHDWGAYLSYLFEQKYPELVEALIIMDVGAHLKPQSVAHALFLISYQWYLIAAFGVAKVLPPAGNIMSRLIAWRGGAPNIAHVRARMNYPYYYFWKRTLLGKKGQLKHYRPQSPVLYFYGTRKKFMFHSPEWLEILEASPGNEIVPIDSGHWLMKEQPDEVNRRMQQWLAQL